MKKILKKFWDFFNLLMTAIGVITFGEDILPSLIKWNDFFVFLIEKIRWIRDLVLLPITYPLREFFNLILFDWWKSYLFIGFLLLNTYNSSYTIICGHFSKSSYMSLLLDNFSLKLKTLYHILYRILLWPIVLVDLIKHYIDKGYEREHNVYTLWGKFIYYLGITILVLLFVNWTINKI